VLNGREVSGAECRGGLRCWVDGRSQVLIGEVSGAGCRGGLRC
jgi:hypothetical protein